MIQIKKLPEIKWKEFKALRLEALQQDPLAFGSSFEEEKKFSDKIWKERIRNTIFAISNDELVGMLSYSVELKTKLAHVAEIFGVFVKEEHRSKKIGKQLLEYAINYIQKNKEVEKIKLTVTSVQDSAINLYATFGFEIVGKLRRELKHGGVYYDGIIMEKIL